MLILGFFIQSSDFISKLRMIKLYFKSSLVCITILGFANILSWHRTFIFIISLTIWIFFSILMCVVFVNPASQVPYRQVKNVYKIRIYYIRFELRVYELAHYKIFLIMQKFSSNFSLIFL